jgi:hypothetical protein
MRLVLAAGLLGQAKRVKLADVSPVLERLLKSEK